MKRNIYLDTAATSIVDEKVSSRIKEVMDNIHGNPSSLHYKGDESKNILEDSRKTVADSLKCNPEDIIFTSGGSESNNLAIKGYALKNKDKGKHIITTKIEHDCILNTCKWLEKKGFEVTYLDVDKEGFISLEDLSDKINEDTILVSIIHGNNEVGTIQEMGKIHDICKSKKVILHTDACQSFMKTEIKSSMADMITINAHKIHGPKGVGALYINDSINLEPLIHGGGQERKLRSGTENVPLIAGFSEAVSLKQNTSKIEDLRDYMILKIKDIHGAKLNGPSENRLCNNVNFSFDYIEGESIIYDLSLKGICVSTGSACSSKSLEGSHVIMAMHDDVERSHNSVRFSLSKYNTKEEIDYVVKELNETVNKLRKISPLLKEV
ncbi:MAG: cysteine desulfurase family protein [Nanobdellota archaeon]